MVFKCKMCGGDIEKIDEHIGKCLYCNSTMTLPNLDNDKIVNLYNRANDLRLSNEFDKAYEMYEKILEIDGEQIEAYWGLVLCKYGVEYVDDPKTKSKIPTCHRTINESILTDSNFFIVKKKSSGEALKLYKKEAEQINDIQKRILDISSKEEPYDIFICYKETDENNERTNDSVIAEEIYEKLTEQKYKVFFARITLEDKLGMEYEPYIFSALKSAKVMLVVGCSKENFEAVWVKNEWSRYLEMMKKDKSKTLIPVYSKMDPYDLPDNFAILQSQNMDKVGAIQDLTRGIKKIIQTSKETTNMTTSDVYEKLKSEMEEKVAGKYEVSIVKEKLDLGYKLLSTVLAILLSILLVYFENSGTGFMGRMHAEDPYNYIIFDYLFSEIIFSTAIIGLISIANRKCYKISKILYAINIIILSIVGIKIKISGDELILSWYGWLLMNAFLLFYPAKWHIDEKRKEYYTNREDKEKQENKNEELVANFKKRDMPRLPIIIVISTILIISIVFTLIYNVDRDNNGNARDNQKLQVQLINQNVEIRESYNKDSKEQGKTNKGEIYTVLECIKDNDSYWFKIQTSNEITGYIYSGEIQKNKHLILTGPIFWQNHFQNLEINEWYNNVHVLELYTSSTNQMKEILQELIKK